MRFALTTWPPPASIWSRSRSTRLIMSERGTGWPRSGSRRWTSSTPGWHASWPLPARSWWRRGGPWRTGGSSLTRRYPRSRRPGRRSRSARGRGACGSGSQAGADRSPGRAQPLPQEPGDRGRLARRPGRTAPLSARCPVRTGGSGAGGSGSALLDSASAGRSGAAHLRGHAEAWRLAPASRRRNPDRRGIDLRVRRPACQAGRDGQLCRAGQARGGRVAGRRGGRSGRLPARRPGSPGGTARGEIELSWIPPQGVLEIRVVRKAGSPPAGPRDGDRIAATLDQALDSGLRPDQVYHYGIYAIYRTADGKRYASPGISWLRFPARRSPPVAAPGSRSHRGESGWTGSSPLGEPSGSSARQGRCPLLPARSSVSLRPSNLGETGCGHGSGPGRGPRSRRQPASAITRLWSWSEAR